MHSSEHWPSYTTDLVLEGLLALFDATGDECYLEFVLRVWEFRGRPRVSLTIGNSYFACLHAETYRRTGDLRFVEGLVEIADEWRRTAPRTSEGAVAHRNDSCGAVLLDMLAGYAPLMAAAGALSGDESFFDECAQQCRLYRDILRDPATGLWHHARDWRVPGALSPAGWCRGQGWAMRALVKSLEWMSPFVVPPSGGSGFAANCVQEILRELASDLPRYQQPSGMWHQLVNEPDSYPETSGTGFIVSTLQTARRNGWIDAAPAANHGARAMSAFVAPDGTVRSGCPGTPPLATREDYRKRGPQTDDPHAVATVLMALA